MNALEELQNYKSRLESERRRLTAEINKKIQRIDEAIATIREGREKDTFRGVSWVYAVDSIYTKAGKAVEEHKALRIL